MNKNWIHAQADFNVTQFDESMQLHNKDAPSYLKSAEKYYARVCIECNYLDAVKLINWETILKENTVILDMGSGGGWLAGYLSLFNSVSSIYALDSSKYFLLDMMPRIIKLMGANYQKIIPVEGLFTPLLLDNESLDIVVASSALHHADNLESALREIRRTLKKDGFLIILNETPGSAARHLFRVIKAFSKILKNLLLRKYFSESPSISSGGYLYDPNLGDRAYPAWYWQQAIKCAGFSIVEQIDTGLPTLKSQSGQSLVHFICKVL